MIVNNFFASSRTIIVAGKGGVGKSTVSAALALAAAQAGLTSLLIELDGKPSLVSGTSHITVRHISPAAALTEYFETHGLARLSKRLVSSGIVDVVATAAPGIDDLLVLGKIKALERERAADIIIVDGPAAGHAVTFCRHRARCMTPWVVGLFVNKHTTCCSSWPTQRDAKSCLSRLPRQHQ